MKDPEKRPKKYFEPREVMEQSMLEPNLFGLYLQQNCTQFFSDIDDLANAMDSFSLVDNNQATISYSYASQGEIFDL